MNADERAIRRVVADWQKLTANENVEGVLALMADDAVFLVAGHPPWTRALRNQSAASSEHAPDRIDRRCAGGGRVRESCLLLERVVRTHDAARWRRRRDLARGKRPHDPAQT